jgi:MFS family permease
MFAPANVKAVNLPTLQVFCIVFAVFADAMNMTIGFSYLVFMTAAMLGLDKGDALLNWYAGLAACSFPVGAMFSGVIYGRLSDKFHCRKPFLIIG